MIDQLVTFHQRGPIAYAFLGVHIVGAVSDAAKWLSVLDGDTGWRRGSGDDMNAREALRAS